MAPQTWKVGDLAKRTGLSVRTLHHYEAIGLLVPAVRTESGHRLYGEAELTRLQRILSLRRLGFSLDEIRRCLEDPAYALAPVIELHLKRLAAEMALQERLMRRLEGLREQLRSGGAVPVESLFETMESISMLNKYPTPDQIRVLEAYRAQGGEDGAPQLRALFDELRRHQAAGLPADAPEARSVAERLRNRTVTDALGADEKLAEGLRNLLANEPSVRERLGLDDALFAYLQEVMAQVA